MLQADELGKSLSGLPGRIVAGYEPKSILTLDNQHKDVSSSENKGTDDSRDRQC
jgi:hypothetical protein